MDKKNELERKRSIISWNGEIDLGHILTILTIIIAVIALSYQRQDLQTKVEDLNAVVQKLEEEKYQRMLQGIEHSTKFSFTLDHTTDRLRNINKLYDNEFMFLLSELNEIFDFLLKDKTLSSIEKEKISLLRHRNFHKQRIYLHAQKFSLDLVEFDALNAPKKENYGEPYQYINAIGLYPDTLRKHIDISLEKLKKSIEEASEEVNNAEKQYFKMINK